MKVHDLVSGEIYEAEVYNSWNSDLHYIKKGTNGPVRYADQVEILDEEINEETADNFDWQSFRREAAKDILCALTHSAAAHYTDKETVKWAIKLTDELIKQLKNG